MSSRAFRPGRGVGLQPDENGILQGQRRCDAWWGPVAALLLGAVSLAATLLVACGGGDEPKDFAQFADQIAAAAREGDVDFFLERIEGTPYTCSATEVAQSRGPDAPERPICLRTGFTFNSVYIQNYPGATQTTTPDVLADDLRAYFKDAVKSASDEYGPGAVRLYATGACIQPPCSGRQVRSAILTAIHEQVFGEQRTVRGLDFEYVDGRWVLTGASAASFPTAAEYLNASTAAPLYNDWTRYAGE